MIYVEIDPKKFLTRILTRTIRGGLSARPRNYGPQSDNRTSRRLYFVSTVRIVCTKCALFTIAMMTAIGIPLVL